MGIIMPETCWVNENKHLYLWHLVGSFLSYKILVSAPSKIHLKKLSSSAGLEIPSISWNLKVHYSIHNSQLLAHNLSQINPVHAPSYLLQNPLNIILPSTPMSSKCSRSFRSLPTQNSSIRLSSRPYVRADKTASRYGGKLRIYKICSRGQPTMCDPPA